MKKINNLEDFVDKLISLKEKEVILSVKREISSSFDSSKCTLIHELLYNDKMKYLFEHKDIMVNSIGQKVFAQLLYEDLTKILQEGERLKSKKIDILLSLNGLGLTYLGHGAYLGKDHKDNYLDLLSLPDLLLDMKKKYKLK